MANLVTKGDTTFSVNDILRLKNSSGDEWLKVLTVIDSEHYTVERDLAGVYLPNDNVPWTAGTAVANYGQSGEGLIYMTASEANSPYIDILTHDGTPWLSTDLKVRLGELDGIIGATGDGIYADYGYLGTLELIDVIKMRPTGRIRTVLEPDDYPHLQIGDNGIALRDNDVGGLYGTAIYGTDVYGWGALVYILNQEIGVPWAELHEPTKDGGTIASVRYFNRSVDPTGTAEIGDLAFVNGCLKKCTVAGTPGTWSSFLTTSGSSTDNAVPKFDGTTGSVLQNTGITINDNDLLQLIASTTDDASLNIPAGTAPSSPSVGDFWSTSDDNGHLYYRKNSSENIDLANQPLAKVYVNSIDDLPEVSSGGKIFLEANTVYEFKIGNLITLTDELVLPNGRIQLVNARITTDDQITLGSGTFNFFSCNLTFTGANASAFVASDLGLGGSVRFSRGTYTFTTNMQVFDVSSTSALSFFLLDQIFITVCGQVGVIDGPIVNISSLEINNFSDGFEFIDNTNGINLNVIGFTSGQNSAGSIMYDVSGTVGQLTFTSLHCIPKSNEKIFYFNPALTFDGIAVANSPIDLTESGVDLTNIFDTGSLNEDTIGAKFTGNVNIQDSTALAQIGFQDNTTQVVIDTASVPIKVNSSSFSEDFSERFTTTSAGTITYNGLECRIVDVKAHMTMRPITGTNIELGCYVGVTRAELVTVTFTNATDKVNLTGSLPNDTSIRFSNSGGALPAEIRDDQFYWVINAGANDFEISDTMGGAALDFTDDGTGTNYYSLGGIINSSEGESTSSSTRVESFGTQSLIEVETGDIIGIFVDNHDTTSNIVVKGIQVTVFS